MFIRLNAYVETIIWDRSSEEGGHSEYQQPSFDLQSPANPGYYTERPIGPPAHTLDSQKKEDIHEIHEVAKEFVGEKYLNREAQYYEYKPAYYTAAETDVNSSKRGFVTIDNVTIVDTLKHSEFTELLNILCNSKQLLFNTEELDKKDEKRKRKLLALLSNINWRICDATLQARLIRSMEERVKLLRKSIQNRLS